MKLVSMVDLVIKQELLWSEDKDNSCIDYFETCCMYAGFLQQNMGDRYLVDGIMAHYRNRFVPCNRDGCIIDPPDGDDCHEAYVRLYNEAKNRVVFKGFTSDSLGIILPNGEYLEESNLKGRRIESIINYGFELTDTGIKLSGLG